jgi:hypothetical protein
LRHQVMMNTLASCPFGPFCAVGCFRGRTFTEASKSPLPRPVRVGERAGLSVVRGDSGNYVRQNVERDRTAPHRNAAEDLGQIVLTTRRGRARMGPHNNLRQSKLHAQPYPLPDPHESGERGLDAELTLSPVTLSPVTLSPTFTRRVARLSRRTYNSRHLTNTRLVLTHAVS